MGIESGQSVSVLNIGRRNRQRLVFIAGRWKWGISVNCLRSEWVIGLSNIQVADLGAGQTIIDPEPTAQNSPPVRVRRYSVGSADAWRDISVGGAEGRPCQRTQSEIGEIRQAEAGQTRNGEAGLGFRCEVNFPAQSIGNIQ